MKHLLILGLLCLCGGCTVISYDRVLPGLAPAWSAEAKAQRESNRRHEAAIRAYQDSLRTNHVDSAPKPQAAIGVDLEAIKKRDGTNVIGVYMGMIAEWDGMTSRYHPPTNYIGGPTGLSFADEGWMETNAHPQGVMMFSATSGQLLKWISYDDFKAIFVDKTKPEYP